MGRWGTATYVPSKAYRGLATFRSFRLLFACLLSLFLLSTLTLTTATTLVKPHSTIAHADDDDTQKTLEKAKESAGITDDKSFEKSINGIDNGTQTFTTEASRNTFGYVLKRLLYTGYLNYTPKGVAGGDGATEHTYNCNKDATGAGTVLYHNCDVPNFITEFAQQMIQLFVPMGFDVVGVESAKSDDGFGIPTLSIPQGTVPLDYANQHTKYTGLELLGYSLHYTSYRGEWDNITVMNSARALSNFGLMDNIHLGVMAAFNGVKGGASGAVNGAEAGWKQGGIIGGITGAFTGFWEGATSATVNTILDTSDLNVFNSHAWYRQNFGSTLYNARELDQTEISRIMTENYLAYVDDEAKAADKQPPADYQALKAGPPKPTDSVGKCTIDGKEYGSKANPVTEDQCKNQGASVSSKNVKWDPTGNVKGQTLAEWWAANQSTVTTAQQKGIECPIDTTTEGTPAERSDKLAKFYTCWEQQWDAHRNTEIKKEIVSKSGRPSGILGNILDFFLKKPERNFNAPWSRFVCTDSQGKDLEAYPYRYLYDKDGNLSPQCKAVRPPIQDGYFGNGYLNNTANPAPAPDTRRTLFGQVSPITAIFDLQNWGTNASNFFLSLTGFFTKVANGALDLAFSPVLEKLGIVQNIAGLIESFRESVYFALIVMMMAFSALTSFVKGAVRGDYRGVLINLGYSIMVFFVGVMVMANPLKTVKFVDETPVIFERAIAGLFFSIPSGQDNQLCTANSSMPTEEATTDLEGNSLAFSPLDSVRSMECEVWRTFYFNPYVQGQWGTNYDNLTTASMQNKNQDLVGDASVPMGGNITEKNWAFYQARVLSSGTSTTEDPKTTTVVKPRDLYRVVDMQAGPDNGKDRDGRYLYSWSGKNFLNRGIVSFTSMLTALLGCVVIIVYSVEKIKVTFLSLLLLMFLPLVLLLAPHPTLGKVNLKKYLGTIGGLLLHRVLLVLLLSVMMKVVQGTTAMNAPILISFLLTVGILLYFLEARHTMFDMINSSVVRASGGQFLTGKTNLTKAARDKTPRAVRNQLQTNRAVLNGVVAGAVGGLVVNGREGVVEGVRGGIQHNLRRNHRNQLRTGLSGVQVVNEAARTGAQAAQKEQRENRERWRTNDVQRHANEALSKRNYEHGIKERKEAEARNASPEEILAIERRRAEPYQVDFYDPHDYKTLVKWEKIENEINALEHSLEILSTTPRRKIAVDKEGTPLKSAVNDDVTDRYNELQANLQKKREELAQTADALFIHGQEKEELSLYQRYQQSLKIKRAELHNEKEAFVEALDGWTSATNAREDRENAVLSKSSFFPTSPLDENRASNMKDRNRDVADEMGDSTNPGGGSK